jgi:hypothetical protein
MRGKYAACVCASCMARRGHVAPLMVALLVVGFILIAVFNTFHRNRVTTGHLLADDVQRLATLFKKIDETCDIIDFEYQKNPINMLTVKKDGFVGSEVGSIHLGKPDKWEGPYVESNPTIQGKEYLVVKNAQGLFITPGEGVVLPNGKEIGKDIVLDEQSDIEYMVRDENFLQFHGRPLAAPLSISSASLRLYDVEELAYVHNVQKDIVS